VEEQITVECERREKHIAWIFLICVKSWRPCMQRISHSMGERVEEEEENIDFVELYEGRPGEGKYAE
jgi:hypothetical protein